MTIRTVPISFDSCRVVYDRIYTQVLRNYSNLVVVDTTRYIIPLGALDDEPVSINPRTTYISHRIIPWTLYLHTNSKVILSDSYDGLQKTRKSEALDLTYLGFSDESTAKRFQSAFLHAAELCRGKEPF